MLKHSVYFLCIFNKLRCILLLSLLFDSGCLPLTLLQLRYILWYFVVCQDQISAFNMCFPIRCLWFYCGLCISYAPFLVMIFLIIARHLYVFTHIIWDLLGWISGSNMFAVMFLTLFFLYFLHCFSYISLAHMDTHFSINKVLLPGWLRRIKNRNSYQSLFHLLTKGASQPPSYLWSIIHID